MSQVAIRAALDARLEVLIATGKIAWENRVYKPNNSVWFVKSNLLPARTANPTMSGDGTLDLKRMQGVYQVKLQYPYNTGPAASDANADALVAHFPRGLSLTSGGITVDILDTPSAAPGFEDGAWWIVPVSIFYRADVL